MVKRNGSHGVEFVEIVLVGPVVAVPRNHVVRAMVLLVLESFALKSSRDSPLFFFVFKRGDWRAEVSFVCETISTNWAEIGDGEVTFVELSNPTTAVLVTFDCHTKLDASWHNQNFGRLHSKFAEFRSH